MAKSKEGPSTQDSPMTAVVVDPADVTVSVGATQQYTATAQYLDGTSADVTAQATWVVYPFELGTIDPTGLLTAGSIGSGTVYATYAGVQSGTNITITVVANPVEVHRAVSPGGTCHLCGWTWNPANSYSSGTDLPHIVHVPAA